MTAEIVTDLAKRRIVEFSKAMEQDRGVLETIAQMDGGEEREISLQYMVAVLGGITGIYIASSSMPGREAIVSELLAAQVQSASASMSRELAGAMARKRDAAE